MTDGWENIDEIDLWKDKSVLSIVCSVFLVVLPFFEHRQSTLYGYQHCVIEAMWDYDDGVRRQVYKMIDIHPGFPSHSSLPIFQKDHDRGEVWCWSQMSIRRPSDRSAIGVVMGLL